MLTGLVPPIFFSAGKQIVANGTVHTFNPAQLTIQLDQLTFELEFLAATEDKQPRVEATANDPRHVKYRLFNFDNPLGAGLREPLKVGKYHNKDLYFIFTVYSFDSGSCKTVHYTFFSDPES